MIPFINRAHDLMFQITKLANILMNRNMNILP